MQVEPVSSVIIWVERMWVHYQVKALATAERHRIITTRWLLTLRNTVHPNKSNTDYSKDFLGLNFPNHTFWGKKRTLRV